MKKSMFGGKKPANPDMALQITSMADIFIILLVFLLKSYATSATNINPTAGVRLPTALTDGQPSEGPKIEISENAVLVESDPISKLTNFRFPAQDLGAAGISKSLEEALKFHKKRQELIAKSNVDVQLDRKILVLADERVPYVTLKSVLASAAVQGFTDFKLVVAKKE